MGFPVCITLQHSRYHLRAPSHKHCDPFRQRLTTSCKCTQKFPQPYLKGLSLPRIVSTQSTSLHYLFDTSIALKEIIRQDKKLKYLLLQLLSQSTIISLLRQSKTLMCKYLLSTALFQPILLTNKLCSPLSYISTNRPYCIHTSIHVSQNAAFSLLLSSITLFL